MRFIVNRNARAATLLGTLIAGCDGATNDNTQGTGGARYTTTGGTSAAHSAGGGASSGGTGGTINTTVIPSTGGNASDAGPTYKTSDVYWMDPKCGGVSDAGTFGPCNICTVTNCAAAFEQMFGAGWMAGAASGPCAGYLNCVRACPCGDKVCYQPCLDAMMASFSSNTDCLTALQSEDSCASTTCRVYCSLSGF